MPPSGVPQSQRMALCSGVRDVNSLDAPGRMQAHPCVLWGGGVVVEQWRSRGMGWDRQGHTHPQDGDKPPMHPAPLHHLLLFITCSSSSPAPLHHLGETCPRGSIGVIIQGKPHWRNHLGALFLLLITPTAGVLNHSPESYFRDFMEWPASPLPSEIHPKLERDQPHTIHARST